MQTAGWKHYLIEFLIVIGGVTVAFQIGSWNEQRKDGIQRKNILSLIHQELIQDTLDLQRVGWYYQRKIELADSVVAGLMTRDRWLNCRDCSGLITHMRWVTISNKGYNQFKASTAFKNVYRDSLFLAMEEYYLGSYENFVFDNQLTEEVALDAIKLWSEKYEWFATMNTADRSQEVIEYQLNSWEYRNLARRARIAAQNQRNDIRRAQRRARRLLELLDEALER